MGSYFLIFPIIRYFYGNGRSLFYRQTLRAALVFLFAAVVFLFCSAFPGVPLAGQFHA